MSHIVLHNVDSKQERARYYALTWLPAITGDGWAVERAWGPLGSRRRQRKIALFRDRDTALDFVAQHLRRRLQHGYAIKDADQSGHILAADRLATKEDE